VKRNFLALYLVPTVEEAEALESIGFESRYIQEPYCISDQLVESLLERFLFAIAKKDSVWFDQLKRKLEERAKAIQLIRLEDTNSIVEVVKEWMAKNE